MSATIGYRQTGRLELEAEEAQNRDILCDYSYYKPSHGLLQLLTGTLQHFPSHSPNVTVHYTLFGFLSLSDTTPCASLNPAYYNTLYLHAEKDH